MVAESTRNLLGDITKVHASRQLVSQTASKHGHPSLIAPTMADTQSSINSQFLIALTMASVDQFLPNTDKSRPYLHTSSTPRAGLLQETNIRFSVRVLIASIPRTTD